MVQKKSTSHRYCNIFEYVEDKYPDVAKLLSAVCLRENTFIPKQGGNVTFLVPTEKSYISKISTMINSQKTSDIEAAFSMLKALIIYNKPLMKGSDFSGPIYNSLNQLMPSATAKSDTEVEFDGGLKAVKDTGYLGPIRDVQRPRTSVWILKGKGEIPTNGQVRERTFPARSPGSGRPGSESTDLSADFGLEDILSTSKPKKPAGKKTGAKGGNEELVWCHKLRKLITENYTPSTWRLPINVYHIKVFMQLKQLQDIDSSFASVANQVLGIEEVTDSALLDFYCRKRWSSEQWKNLYDVVAYLMSSDGDAARAKITQTVYNNFRDEILLQYRPQEVVIPLTERVRALKAVVLFKARCRDLYAKYRGEYNTDESLGHDLFIVHTGYNKHKWITSGNVADYLNWVEGLRLFKEIVEYARIPFEHAYELEITYKLLISDLLCGLPPLSSYVPPSDYVTINTYDTMLDGTYLVSMIKSIQDLQPAPIRVSGGCDLSNGAKLASQYLPE